MIPMTSEGEFSQADLRAHREFRDQHGRIWGTQIENKTQAPTGPMSPQFQAPMYPDSKYFRFRDRDTNKLTYAAGTFWIDYDAWIHDRSDAMRMWEQERYMLAIQKYGAGAQDAIDRKDPALHAMVGEPPFPVEPVLAMQQGNPWVLGLAETPDPRLAPYFQRHVRAVPDFRGTAPEPTAKAGVPLSRFPVHTGGGIYLFSDGQETKMDSKDDAVAYEAALQEA